MAGSKDMILIKGREFIQDFKSLNSSGSEVTKSLKAAGLSAQTFYNWSYRMNEDGTSRVSEAVFAKLCEVSGLSYGDYFIARTTYFRNPKAKKQKASGCRQKRLKNGITITTYTRNKDTADKVDTVNTVDNASTDNKESKCIDVKKDMFAVSSFRHHMIIYRKLLGISTSDMEDVYGILDYKGIENGTATLSISTYMKLSGIFMDAYKKLDNPVIKNAFEELAANYNDIYIKVVYFGDVIAKRGR